MLASVPITSAEPDGFTRISRSGGFTPAEHSPALGVSWPVRAYTGGTFSLVQHIEGAVLKKLPMCAYNYFWLRFTSAGGSVNESELRSSF